MRLVLKEREQVQQEIVANRNERKERFAAFLRMQYERSMQMLQAGSSADAEATRASVEQIKEDRQIEDLSLFLYRLDSDFEDKKRRLEKMLFQQPVRFACSASSTRIPITDFGLIRTANSLLMNDF